MMNPASISLEFIPSQILDVFKLDKLAQYEVRLYILYWDMSLPIQYIAIVLFFTPNLSFTFRNSAPKIGL